MQKKLTCYRCKKKFDGDRSQGNLCEGCRERRSAIGVHVSPETAHIIIKLLTETTREHRDATSANYNYCDQGECNWCEQALVCIDKLLLAQKRPIMPDEAH